MSLYVWSVRALRRMSTDKRRHLCVISGHLWVDSGASPHFPLGLDACRWPLIDILERGSTPAYTLPFPPIYSTLPELCLEEAPRLLASLTRDEQVTAVAGGLGDAHAQPMHIVISWDYYWQPRINIIQSSSSLKVLIRNLCPQHAFASGSSGFSGTPPSVEDVNLYPRPSISPPRSTSKQQRSRCPPMPYGLTSICDTPTQRRRYTDTSPYTRHSQW